VKLRELNLTSPIDIFEGLDYKQREKLARIEMLITKQGKDPEPIINRIRGMIDPEFAKSKGRAATLKSWVAAAKPGEKKQGKLHDRKVEITVLEAALHDCISEGIFGDIGKILSRKISNLLRDEPKEDENIKSVLDTYPALAALQRYAAQAKDHIKDDPRFWELVEKVSPGHGEEVKKWVSATYRHRVTESKDGKIPGLFTKCIIEAKISDEMRALGMGEEEITDLLAKGEIQDISYVGSEIRGAAKSAVQAPGKALRGAYGAVRGKTQKWAGDVRELNDDFVSAVILTAGMIIKTTSEAAKAKETGMTQQPGAAEKVVDKAAEDLGLPSGEYEEVKPATPTAEVSQADLVPM
jgi:hypothetical protein